MADAVIKLGPRRVVVQRKGGIGPSGTAGAQGPAGDLAKAVGRAAMAGIAGAGNMVRNLVEGGRSGLFTFVEGDLSAMVAIDTRQAVYIAPDSDPTGASGAWVRQYNGDLRAEWFGLASDDATDDAPAISAGLLLAKGMASAFTYIAGGPALRLPANAKCYCASAITMQKGVGLLGGGKSYAERSQLRFAANVHGLNILATDGAGVGPNAQGSYFRGIKLQGAFNPAAPSEGEHHAVNAETAFDGRDFYIEGFQGDGIHLESTSGAENNYSQQGNGFVIRDYFISSCRDNIYVHGQDANAGEIGKGHTLYARRWGVYDGSFLGNFIGPVQTDGCGSTTAYAGIPTCGVTYGGKRYSVKKGQEVGASTNAPSGTTADNTWWYYCFDGVSGNPAWPDWVNGITVRAGGPFWVNSSSTLIEPYVESAQPVSQMQQGAIVIGSQAAATFRGFGTIIRDYQGWTRIGGSGSGRGMIVDGNVIFNGPSNGGNDVEFNGQNFIFTDPTYSINLAFQLNEVTHSSILGYVGFLRFKHTTDIRFDINGTTIADFVAGGLDFAAGKAVKVEGAQVVGARKTGWAAGTGTATRTTFDTATVTLPQLAERVKALIDDLHAAAGHGLIGA